MPDRPNPAGPVNLSGPRQSQGAVNPRGHRYGLIRPALKAGYGGRFGGPVRVALFTSLRGWGKLGGARREDAQRLEARNAVSEAVDMMAGSAGMPLLLEQAVWLADAYDDPNVFFIEEPLSPTT